MTEKRFTTVELPKPNPWGIWYDGRYLSTYQACTLLNEYVDIKKEITPKQGCIDYSAYEQIIKYLKGEN